MAALARQRLTRLRGPTLSPARLDVTQSAVQAHHPAAWVHGLQQSLGNQTVQRLLHSRAIQAQLTMSRPGDQYEDEADQTTAHVMRMPELQRQTGEAGKTPPAAPRVPLRPQPRVSLPPEQAVRQWLDDNTDDLHRLSLASLIARVQQNVPEARLLLPGQTANVIRAWASYYRLTIPPPGFSIVPEPSEIPPEVAGPDIAGRLLESDVARAVEDAISLVSDGVDVRVSGGRRTSFQVERATKASGEADVPPLSGGRINVSISGATLAMRRGAPAAFAIETTIGWTGGISLKTSYGDWYFAGEVTPERWSMSLSYPTDAVVPDVTRVGNIFRAGETALRSAHEAVESFQASKDVSAAVEAAKPYVEPVTEAVKAAESIAKVPASRVSVGISASGPTAAEVGSPTQPSGLQVAATLTITF